MGPAEERMHYVLTMGYNPAKKQFVGTWVDSMLNHMWHYEGTLDGARKVLTLSAEGPDMQVPEKTTKYRDVIELVDADHKTLTSHAMAEDGSWVKYGTTRYTRKKQEIGFAA